MSLNKNRIKKLEEVKSKNNNETAIFAISYDGVITHKNKEYTREDFKKLYPNAEICDVEFVWYKIISI